MTNNQQITQITYLKLETNDLNIILGQEKIFAMKNGGMLIAYFFESFARLIATGAMVTYYADLQYADPNFLEKIAIKFAEFYD